MMTKLFDIKKSMMKGCFMKKNSIVLVLAIAVMGIFGCQTPEYYQEQAVIKAREFLLKNSPDLSLDEIAYIKYNRPVIVHEGIFASTLSVKSSVIGSDLSQIGVLWQLPERKDMIMVWGVSSESLAFFRPERVIVREIKLANKNLEKAQAEAKKLILNSLIKELSIEEYNYIRFAEPEIWISSFVFDKGEKASVNSSDIMQIAFVWKIRGGEFSAVAAGETDKDFSQFVPYASGVFSAEDLKEDLVKTYDEFLADSQKSVETAPADKAEETKNEEEAK